MTDRFNSGSKPPFRLVWGITGAGDLLVETFTIIEGLKKSGSATVTVLLSHAAVNVVKWYRLWSKLQSLTENVLIEKDANTPFIAGDLQTGKYDCLLIAPATANTVAKIVHGIADTFITNTVALTNKTSAKIYIMPVDKEEGEITTRGPDGKIRRLYIRRVDAQNTEKLRKMQGISVLETPEDIRGIIR